MLALVTVDDMCHSARNVFNSIELNGKLISEYEISKNESNQY